MLLFGACLAAQLYLVFFKSFNWDEFLHYNFVLQLKAGTLDLPFQVLHLRALWWASEVTTNLLDQMRTARVFIWGLHLLTLFLIYGVARNFASVPNAFFAAFAYLTAGFVFTHGFSIRADPFVTATLMCALFLLARGTLGLAKAAAVGVLIGLAGLMTLKSVLFLPCFAGLVWMKFREAPRKRAFLRNLVVLITTAIGAFGAICLHYAPDTAGVAQPAQRTSQLSFYLRWFTPDLEFAGYTAKEIVLAPVFFVAVALAPLAWRRSRLGADRQIALAGFLAPLATLLIYRNTFPYFFVFILAPVAVGIVSALAWARERYGNVFLSVALSAMPLALAVLEPREVIGRQQALIEYVHREFPDRPGYLDYSSMIADYPRILTFLTSGNGIRLYHEQGEPIVGREIERGNVPFIIANNLVIKGALEGHPVPGTFLPADLTAISGNYVQQWGVLWREGTLIPAGSHAFAFRLRRGGEFILAGQPMIVDGRSMAHGDRIELSRGTHLVSGGRSAQSILWRGTKLPGTPPNISMDRVFTNF